MTVKLKKLKYKSTPISKTTPIVPPVVLWVNMNQTQTLSVSGRQAQWTSLLFYLNSTPWPPPTQDPSFLKLSSVKKIIISIIKLMSEKSDTIYPTSVPKINKYQAKTIACEIAKVYIITSQCEIPPHSNPNCTPLRHGTRRVAEPMSRTLLWHHLQH